MNFEDIAKQAKNASLEMAELTTEVKNKALLKIADALEENKSQISLIASGLNGYVVHIAMRWVLSSFKQPFEQVLEACSLAYLGIYQQFNLKSKSQG